MFQRIPWSGFVVDLLAVLVGLVSAGDQAAREGQPTQKPAPATNAGQPAARRAEDAPAVRLPLQRVFDEALLAAKAIGDPEDRSMQLLSLAWAQWHQGKHAEARATVAEAYGAAVAIRPDAAPIIPHPIVLIGQAEAAFGDREAAHRTFEQAVRMISAEDDGRQIGDWINMVPIQRAVESRAAMAGTLRAFRNHCERDEHWGPDRLIGIDAALSGNVDEAIREITTRKIDDPRFRGEIPVDLEHWRCNWLLSVLSYFGRDERDRIRPVLAEVRRIIDGPLRPRLRPAKLQELANTEARLGLFNEAVATAEAIDPGDGNDLATGDDRLANGGIFKKVEAFAGVAETRLEAGDFQGARRTAGRAIEVARAAKAEARPDFPLYRAIKVLIRTDDLEGGRRAIELLRWPPLVVVALREQARAEARLGDPGRARATRARALDIARRSAEEAATVAELQAEMGDVAGASRTLDAITGKEKDDALCRLAGALASGGQLDAAIAVAERLTDPVGKARAWIGIARAQRPSR